MGYFSSEDKISCHLEVILADPNSMFTVPWRNASAQGERSIGFWNAAGRLRSHGIHDSVRGGKTVCLNSLGPKADQQSGIGWKVMVRKDVLHSLYDSLVRYGTRYCINQEYNAEYCRLVKDSELRCEETRERYPNGFHIFLRLEDAKAHRDTWLGGYRDRQVVVQVRWRDPQAFGIQKIVSPAKNYRYEGVSCVVAKFMTLEGQVEDHPTNV